MAMKRVCDLCGASIMEGTAYMFPVPSVLTDNSGADAKAVDSSMTDVCLKCATTRQADIVAKIVAKATG